MICSSESYEILMVIGGYTAENDVEMIDLSGQDRNCLKPDYFPGENIEAMTGAYIEDVDNAIVCGGWTGSQYRSTCYVYQPDTRTWSLSGTTLSAPKGFTASTFIEGQWFITGGRNASFYIKETESYDSGSDTFLSGVDMPVERFVHTIVSYSETSAIVFGNDFETDETFIYDSISETWTDGPALQTARDESQGGLVQFPNGTNVVVAAGGSHTSTTEILDSETRTWSYGPELPYNIENGASVQYKDSFLIVGGSSVGTRLDTIWMFNTKGYWQELNQTLAIPRFHSVAILVPDSYCIVE